MAGQKSGLLGGVWRVGPLAQPDTGLVDRGRVMFWVVVGSVVAVVLVLAWLADRKWDGIDPTPRHTQSRAQAESDQATTGFNGGTFGGGSL